MSACINLASVLITAHGLGVTNASVVLLIAAILSGLAGVLGMRAVHQGHRSRWTVVWMFAVFICQCLVLGWRGELRGQCPLGDTGEILVFLAWSMTMIYLCIGSTYRLSLLGVFTAPVVSVMQLVAVIPGMMEAAPEHADTVNAWKEGHAAMSVLSYGALGLAAIAGVMFLVLNKQLKSHHLSTGLFKNLPPVASLMKSVMRLLVLGVVLLTAGVVCGFMMGSKGGAHFWVAVAVWAAYIVLMAVWKVRGIVPRQMATLVVALYVISLFVFAAL